MLKFSKANAKTERLYKVPQLRKWLEGGRKVYSFDLLSGSTCPAALECKSQAVELPNGSLKIKDGPQTKFRCFSASNEVLYKNLYRLRKHNTRRILKIASKDGPEKTAKELKKWCPKDAGIIRVHVGGDFANRNYFLGWLKFVEQHPDILVYGYTKQLKFWIEYKNIIDKLPNLSLTASLGGKYDNLIQDYKLRSAKVVFSQYEAKKLGLAIDHDDSHAALPNKKDFGLLLHGAQPNGRAGKAWARIKKTAGGYSR